MENTATTKTAMISYNNFVEGEDNGWKKNGNNEVLLLQNSSHWGMSQRGNEELWQKEAREVIDPLWHELLKALPTLDKVYIYVGSSGSERAIEFAAKHGLPYEKVVFVKCGCQIASKVALIERYGFAESERIMCECGGHRTMRRIYNALIA